jgi:uncharacterized protein YjhX (UPF0386 family)
MITISNGKRQIIINDDEIKIAEIDCYDFMDWIENAIREKIKRVSDGLILENTDKNPYKLTENDKMQIIKNLKLISAKEKSEILGGI